MTGGGHLADETLTERQRGTSDGGAGETVAGHQDQFLPLVGEIQRTYVHHHLALDAVDDAVDLHRSAVCLGGGLNDAL